MIQPVNLPKLHKPIQSELEEAVLRVLHSAAYCLGPEVETFEGHFAEYCGTDYAVGVNSGTSALHLALLAAGVGPGDEVITSPFSFIASSAAIRYCGARPVYVDIVPESYLLDINRIEAAMTSKTKAILPVHLFGQMVDMEALSELARNHQLAIIEDAAQAHGSTFKGQQPGSFGHQACFSFYPTKNLGACGEGGMITGQDPELEKCVRSLRSWGSGQPGDYNHTLEGFNYRLEGIQAAVLDVKLKYLESWIERRRQNAIAYREQLDEAGISCPVELPDRRHVYHQFTIRVHAREKIAEQLKEQDILTGAFYPIPLHRQKAYHDLGYREGDFPHAEKAAAEVMQLPVGPELTPEEITRVAEALKKVVSR
jgi:dTDP-4-amino-4,6-dideoxygalactose transaminase